MKWYCIKKLSKVQYHFIKTRGYMNRILIFAGAGISAESGLSTFRDTGGIWEQFNVDEVCNIHAFKKAKHDDIARANIFNFYNLVKESILKAEPNEAHYQIARWQKQYGKNRVIIMTANIDNLFEKAGCEDVIHIHGEMFNMHCHSCSHIWNIGEAQYNHHDRCPKCNSRLTKPNVVFFGEQAPLYEKMGYHFHPKRMNRDDIILYIGSSMSVIPPTRLFSDAYPPANMYRVLINKEENSLDRMFSHKYYGNATEELKKVDVAIIQNTMK